MNFKKRQLCTQERTDTKLSTTFCGKPDIQLNNTNKLLTEKDITIRTMILTPRIITFICFGKAAIACSKIGEDKIGLA